MQKMIIHYQQNVYHKFMLLLSEVRFGEAKIGYIFKFKLFNEKDKFEGSITITKNYNQRNLKKPPTIKEII